MGARFDSFHAKVLLFGEYTLMLNSRALSIPFETFSGHLALPGPGGDSSEERQLASNKALRRFADYLKSIKETMDAAGISVDRFSTEVDKGLYFESDIPQSYGAGSSGALVAAVYSTYAARPVWKNRTEDFPELKKLFAVMESFFHGRSSGLDPLICYAGKPLLVNTDGTVDIAETANYNSISDFGIFLLDTKMTGDTGPLVNSFLNKINSSEYRQKIEDFLIPVTNVCIDNFLAADFASLLNNVHEVSRWQLELFRDMVPKGFMAIWEEGLKGGGMKIKLCGSGGGGYLLCFTANKQECASILQLGKLSYIPLM
jgi:mevalonate kinase